MKIHKKLFGIISLFSITQSAVGQILPAIMLVNNIALWGVTIWNFFHTGHKSTEMAKFTYDTALESHRNAMFHKISQSLPELSQQFEAFEEGILNQMTNMQELIQKVQVNVIINRRLLNLVQGIGTVDSAFDNFKRRISIQGKSFTPADMCLFAMQQLYHAPIGVKVDNTFNILGEDQTLQTPLLKLLRGVLESKTRDICGSGHSPHEYLHGMYMKLLTIEMKAYVLKVYSHSLLSKYNGTMAACEYRHANTAAGVQLAYNNLRDHVRKLNRMFISKMKGLSRKFRACDQGKNFTRDMTYFELEGAIQGILQLPGGQQFGMLQTTESCEDQDSDKGRQYCSDEWKFCATHPPRSCFGRIYDCKSVGLLVDACLEENGPRRYKWVTSHYIKSGDSEKGCGRSNEMNFHGFRNTCLCVCNDNNVESPTRHVFNLQAVESNVHDNMVVTGVRFVVKYGILQLQIQQGKLGANWKVTKVRWKRINDISDDIRRVRLGRGFYEDLPNIVENRDFLILRRGKNNEINLDTLMVPHKHVLTGVKFTAIERKSSFHRIAISLIATKFNHTTGKLCTNCQKQIILSEEYHNQQLMYDRTNPYMPQFPTLPNSQPVNYTVIDQSDFETDAGQATLPYFDAIPVVSMPPSPLGGVELFHKTKNDFAGFLSLQLISLDYVKYMYESENEFNKHVNVTIEE